MKKQPAFFCAFFFLLHLAGAHAQPVKPGTSNNRSYDHVDTRIDNMAYWMKMAGAGLVPYNPQLRLEPAIYKGSRIKVPGVKTTNSPDVPVTNLTNVTESENSVFVDPNNVDYILNSNNSTTWTGSSAGSVLGANYFQSTNAGTGWAGSPNGAGGSNRGDPATAIGLNGREYVNFISSSSGQGIAYSDNGTNWSTALVAPNPGSLADKNHLWIDNKSTSPHEGNLYVAWTDFGGIDDGEIKLSRSINEGVTWSTPLKISGAINAGSHNQGVNIQTGPNGEVYAAWAVYDSWPSDESAIALAKSTDGGTTFPAASRILNNIKGIRTTAVSKNHRVNSFPSMAVDISGGPNNGNIYVIWTNIGTPGINTGTNKSVYLIRSTDGGATWSTPIRVNQGPNAAGREAYFPWISCDPETGVLSVVFYDDRNVSSTECEVFCAFSKDAGNTWTDFQVSDVSFTPASIPGLASGYMGDYLGITSKGGKAYPCWTDNRGGVYMTYVSPFELDLNANFIGSNSLICTGSAVTFTDQSSGSPTSWNWSFPGGTPSAFVGEVPPAINYNVAGTHDVSLTVSDGVSTDTETRSGYLVVKNVVADFSGSPTTVVVGNTLTFTDNSSCSPETWEWSFPGGTPSVHSGHTPPPVTYNTIGSYDVSLTVARPGGTDTRLRSGYITVSPPVFNIANGSVTTCTGDFYDSGGPLSGYQNNETFTETFFPGTPGSMIRFSFASFSTETGYDTLTIYNGINSSAPVIGKFHGTGSPGVVTASNGAGALTFRFHSDAYVTSSGWQASISCYDGTDPPQAEFSASPLNPLAGQTVTFSDLSVNLPASWLWSFDPPNVTYTGGTDATSQNPQVQFPVLGPYTVTLTATNAYGSDAEVKENYIHVTDCIVSTFPWIADFENGGLIPGCWTQEQVNNSGVNWVFITGNGAGYPVNAHSGTYNSCLKDETPQENKTRLISPAVNLAALPSPQLKFWHTQAYWSPDQDLLTVYYKTSAAGTWTLLASYAESITTWTEETIPLPEASNEYYLAFEGNAKYGRGVCVDDVEISSSCAIIYPVSVAIVASANPVDEGVPVTFTATGVNEGTSPAYQWKVNNIYSGTNSSTYTYIPSDGDAVSCVLTSSMPCGGGNPAVSNTITITVTSVPEIRNISNVTVTGTACYDATQTIVVAGSGTTVTISSGGNATMIAGQNILFYPGAEVEPGGYLHGYIVPAGPWCSAPPEPLVKTETNEGKDTPERLFFRVFPNPTTGIFTLLFNGNVAFETYSVAVYNMNGERVASASMSNEMRHDFNLSGWPAGLYHVRVDSRNLSGSLRVVKAD